MMVADDQTVENVQNLRKRFTEKGAALDASETVIYCNSGISASFGMLALELAGARNLRVYDGSWKEWGNDAATPKETGN